MRDHRRAVAVFIPELHAHGGTERATLECLLRWATTRSVAVYTERVDCELPPEVAVQRVWIPPGPHLVRWAIFYIWASSRAWVLRRSKRRPIIFTPGINMFRADVTVSHMNLARHEQRFRELRFPWGAGRPPFLQGGGWAFVLQRLHRWAYRRLLVSLEGPYYRRAKYVFAVSPSDREALAAQGVQSVKLAPNGVDVTRLRETHRVERKDRLKVVAVGNDVWTKGLDLAIRALASPLLVGRVDLTIFAREANRALLEGLATSLGVANALSVDSRSRDTKDLFVGFELLVAPSRDDSFNMPVLEAIACGLPVIVSDHCGVTHWLAGIAEIVRAGNDADLAAAIATYLDGGRARLPTAERAFVAEMTWDVPAAAVEQAFRELDEFPR